MTPMDKLQDMLMHITYKPGWEIVAEWGKTSFIGGKDKYGRDIMLRISYKTPDVITPDRQVKIGRVRRIDVWMLAHTEEEHLEEALYREIEYLIREAEEHEFREWLRFDGIPVRDPHPKEGL